MQELILVAASGLAREIIAGLSDSTLQRVVGIVDDNAASLPAEISGVPVLGAIDDVATRDEQLLVCVGAGAGRERIVARLAELGVGPERYATVVDPSVRNPGGSPVGHGSILLARVTITADAVVGSHVVMMPGVTVTHDDRIEDYATIAAGVALGGTVTVGRGAYLGMNSAVRQGLDVGAYSVLGMGAALLEDLPAHETWAGVPARRLPSRIPQSPPSTSDEPPRPQLVTTPADQHPRGNP